MLRTYFQETFYDMDVDIARKYAEAIKAAIVLGQSFDAEKKQGFFISKKRGFEDKLYIGNIHRIENRLEWNGEELAEDDEIINVVMIDGPVTRDGDGCSYGSKDHRDQILYANTIPQVVGHIFIINTPGGAASARIDYEQAIADCREKGKPTVAWVDGMCCSAGQLVASLCDRTIAMNGRDTMGCIGTMCAFWGVANGTVDKDGYRYIELVSVTSPDKNAEYREACDGKTEKLQAELDVLGEEFRETVKANRPLVKEEHLTGKTFDAQDVMGALVDEIGDYTRAIECVFELAGGTMPAARTAVPGEESAPAEGEENEEMAKLTEQQKAAISANRESNLTVDDGKVEKTVDTLFGPEQQEIGNPKNSNNMTKEEEMKAQEAAAAQAAAQETTEQPVATEEAPAEAPATEEPENHTNSEGGEPTNSEGAEPAAEEPAASEAPASEETTAEVQAEIDKIQETLHNAEQMLEKKDVHIAKLMEQLGQTTNTIAERDHSIGQLQADVDAARKGLDEKDALIAERDKTITELQTTIEAQKKQLAEKEAEIKELAGAPAHMVDAGAGIPAGNGTGDAPKQKQCKYRRGMDYKEYLAAAKEQ